MSREHATDRRLLSSGTGSMRRMTLGAAVLVVIQIAVGMVVNLYVTVPKDHPGAHPANYFSGSFHSVVWALGHGAAALVLHASLGLALVVVTFLVAVRAVRHGPRAVSVTYVLGFLFVVGAGFNGASFLDFAGQNISSLIMALLALAALCCYLFGLYLLPAQPPTSRARQHSCQ
jgi:hypothetical protein